MYETKRVLIWGKTYPELSWKSKETVCTGGCTEDGKPIRLYPVKLRYLAKHQQYGLYHWVQVPVERNRNDVRPESFRVHAEQIEVLERLGTARGWRDRANVLFADQSWHYDCVEDLKERQKVAHHSLGLVRVGAVRDVRLVERPASARRKHERKLVELGSTMDLFSNVEQKDLEFIPYRVVLRWWCQRRSGPRPCPGHSAAVLDWGLMELGRKRGPEAAKAKMEELADLTRYDLRLFMGNFFTHQNVFGIIGLWYPLRREMGQAELFSSL